MGANGIFRSRETTHIVLVSGMLVVLFGLMSLLTGGKLLKLDSLQSIAFQMPLLGLLTIAQMGPMLTGGIDLSIISSASLSGIISGIILTTQPTWYQVPLAIFCGIGTAMFVAFLNGILIAFANVPAIISTLGMMIFVRGVALVVTKGTILAGFPEKFLFIGSGSILGIPIPFIIFVFFLVFMMFILNNIPYGMKVYMLGSNPVATLFSGVNNKAVIFNTYFFAGIIVGVASQVMTARFNAAQASYGESYLLLTVLACVLGGIDPAGGIGNVIGVFVAICVLQIIATGFNLIGLSSHLASALWGIILLVIIVINTALFEEKY